jgi:hypothetical protein
VPDTPRPRRSPCLRTEAFKQDGGGARPEGVELESVGAANLERLVGDAFEQRAAFTHAWERRKLRQGSSKSRSATLKVVVGCSKPWRGGSTTGPFGIKVVEFLPNGRVASRSSNEFCRR